MRRKPRSEKVEKREARRARVRRTLGRSGRPRLTVFRSAKHIYAQLDDPMTGRTLASVSSRSQQVVGDLAGAGKIEAARRVGAAMAEVARAKQIEKVVFNRNGFLYHGRVKALAEAARDGGLQF